MQIPRNIFGQQKYDRDFNEVFAIQSEVAQEIAYTAQRQVNYG